MKKTLLILFIMFWQAASGQHVFEKCASLWCGSFGGVGSETKESLGLSTNDRVIVLLDYSICMFDTAGNRLKCMESSPFKIRFNRVAELNSNRFIVASILDTMNAGYLCLSMIDSSFNSLYTQVILHDTNAIKLHWPLFQHMEVNTKVEKVLITPFNTILIGLHAIDSNDRMGMLIMEFDTLFNNIRSGYLYSLDSENSLMDMEIGPDSNYYFITTDSMIGKVIKLDRSFSLLNSVSYSGFGPHSFSMLGSDLFIMAVSDSIWIKLLMNDQLVTRNIHRLECDTAQGISRVVFVGDKLILETDFHGSIGGYDIMQRNYVLADTSINIVTKDILYYYRPTRPTDFSYSEYGSYSKFNNVLLNVRQDHFYVGMPNVGWRSEVYFTSETLDLKSCSSLSWGTPNCQFVTDVLTSMNSVIYIDSVSVSSFSHTLPLTINTSIFPTQLCNKILSVSEVVDADRIIFYPNPSNGILNYSIEDDSELSIFSMDGKLVRKNFLIAGEGVILAHGLSNGIYYFVLKGKGSVATRKIVLID